MKIVDVILKFDLSNLILFFTNKVLFKPFASISSDTSDSETEARFSNCKVLYQSSITE